MEKLNKDDLVALVRILHAGRGSEEDRRRLLEVIERNLIHPRVSDLIFYENLTPEEVVEKALSYKPIQL